MPDLDLAELDRLHAKQEENRLDPRFPTDTWYRDERNWERHLASCYPSLRARIAELERKAKAFDEIRELFDRFDTRFAGARDQVLLTDDLLERTRDAISAAVAAKESKQ